MCSLQALKKVWNNLPGIYDPEMPFYYILKMFSAFGPCQNIYQSIKQYVGKATAMNPKPDKNKI